MQAHRQYCNTSFGAEGGDQGEVISMSDEEFEEFEELGKEELAVEKDPNSSPRLLSALFLQDILGKLAISGDASFTIYTIPTYVSPVPICYCIFGVAVCPACLTATPNVGWRVLSCSVG